MIVAAGREFTAPTLAPWPWLMYVQRDPSRGLPLPGQILTDQDLENVNDEVNSKMNKGEGLPSVTDEWQPWRDPGWCGDFAVTKRELLLRLGWPTSAVLIAEVLTAISEYHAVVLINGTRQVVLDILTTQIREPSRTGYKWLKIQNPEDPNQWFEETRA